MKKLVIYYSLTGNTEIVASKLAEQGYELRRVYEKKKMPKSFFWMILAGGFRAGMHLKGKLIDYNSDVSSYDEIVILSPIWNGLTPPAINSVLKLTKLDDKKVSFIFCSGSGEAPKMIKKLSKTFSSSKVVVLKEPKKYSEELNKINSL